MFCFRRKLNCTTQYIYKALFVDGRNYDVVVDALGKEWRLHKVYLTQVKINYMYFQFLVLVSKGISFAFNTCTSRVHKKVLFFTGRDVCFPFVFVGSLQAPFGLFQCIRNLLTFDILKSIINM